MFCELGLVSSWS
uniref:Uncharacterized protein n=1 Tax=Arundo donax TaxID=35708 RepID=A0A0A9EH29_ARUDO